ncbi:MAG: insulinase family protein [Bacteroidota bacterium]|nr:insulinase family protein [Bacteroidota bacterium]
MKKVIVLLLSLVLVAQAQNPLKPQDKLPLSPKVKRGVLKNGMSYYIEKNTKPENRAELRLAVNAGSTMENDDQQGLAHFVEHMAFNGSKNFKKNDLVNYLESIGTKFGPDLNAFTSFDETVYMLQIPTDKKDIVDKGLLILKDWSHNLSFDSVEIEKERGVVMEEWRLGQGAMERMNRKTWPVMFKDSRYAERLPIGKPEILKNCKQSLLKQFYKDWYRTDLQAIIVVGDINVEEMEKKIIEVFSDIPAPINPKPIKVWEVPDQKDFRVAVASDKESPYNMIQLAYMQKENNNVTKTYADFKQTIMQELYNGMINGRLSELTKQASPPFMFGYTGYFSMVRSKASYGSFAITSNGKEVNALKALITENERVKRFGFNQSELDRQKKQLMTNMENQYNEKDKTESKQLVMQYVYNFLTGEAEPGVENRYSYYKDLVPQITLEDINALAKKWIGNGENAVSIMMLAENESSKKPLEDEIKAAFNEAQTNKDIKAYEDKVINEPLISKKPSPQKVFKTTDRGYGITEWTLGNGVKVLLKPTTFKNDEINMQAYSVGGTCQYPEKDRLNADFSNSIQDESGYGKFDAIALEKYLQDKTARLYTGVGTYDESLFGNSNKKDVETLLQLVNLVFTKPRKDSIAFLSAIEKQKAFLQNAGSDPDQVFGDSVRYFMSSYHSSAKPTKMEDLANLDQKNCNQIFKERFSDPSDFMFIFVGSFTLEEIKPLIETYIGGISASTKHEKITDIGAKTPKGAYTKVYKKGNEPRSRVNLSWTNTFEYSRKNRFEVYALMKLLNITLRENLREDKGGVYGVGIYPAMSYTPNAGLKITCTFACAPENVEKLVNATKEEIAKVKKDGGNDENLTKVKEGFLKERELQLKENDFWMSYIMGSETAGENLTDIDKYKDWVKALKKEDFKAFANKYIIDGELKQFVLNPEK